MGETTVKRDGGPYDAAATLARTLIGAEGVVLLVYQDRNGDDGYTLQMPKEVRGQVPRILREMADAIERNPTGAA